MLRKLRQSDLTALRALSAAVGWPHRERDWALFLALGEGLAACAPDGAILGTAMRWRWSPAFGTIGMVLVAPPQQGRGLGRIVMQGLLDADPEQATMLHATQAGLGLYECLGYRPIGMVCQHQGIVATTPHESASRPAQAADLSGLVALDTAAFGASRAPLIERLMAEGDIRVIERGGRLRGFAARRPFGRGETIGPLVAENEDDAITLVAAVLRAGFQRIDIPVQAKSLAAWLTSAGLPPVDSVTTMTRGAWPKTGAAMRRFALASQALG